MKFNYSSCLKQSDSSLKLKENQNWDWQRECRVCKKIRFCKIYTKYYVYYQMHEKDNMWEQVFSTAHR